MKSENVTKGIENCSINEPSDVTHYYQGGGGGIP